MGYECPWWRPTGGGGWGYDRPDSTVDSTLNYLAKAYGKMIYASAGDLHSIWGPNVIDQNGNEIEVEIEVPEESFDNKKVIDTVKAGDAELSGKTVKTKRVKARGVFARGGGDPSNPKFFPKPHLTSISTSGMDNLGIQEKASYSYKTYNGYQGVTPPMIGSSAACSWGWAYGGSVLRGCSKSGIVTGWTSTANMEGGYDVTVDMLCTNASINNLAMAADQACAAITNPGITDEAGNAMAVGGIRDAIAAAAAEASNAQAEGSFTFNNGQEGWIIKFPGSMANPPAPGAEAPKEPLPDVFKAYVKFSSVINLCNAVLKEYNPAVQIVFDKSSRTPIKFTVTPVSADPFELLTPGTSTYGTLTPSPGGGSFTGLPETLWIGADYLIKQIEETNAITINKQANGGPTKYLSFKGFLDSLFSMFNNNLGKMYNLTCANSAVKNDSMIYIVDFNNVEKVSPNGFGTVRSATATAKLDGDQTSIFYTLKNPPKEIASLVKGGASAVAEYGASRYAEHCTALGTTRNATTMNAVRDDNNNIVAAAMANSPDYSVPCNWNLSVTTDGSSYKYGGVVTHPVVAGFEPITNYKVLFAITSVNHSVSAGDWTTSVSTYSRIFKK